MSQATFFDGPRGREILRSGRLESRASDAGSSHPREGESALGLAAARWAGDNTGPGDGQQESGGCRWIGFFPPPTTRS